jgi:hypothetical protein
MTTPMPPYTPEPAEPIKPRSTGTLPLVFGIILLVFGFFPTVRGSSLLLLSAVRTDPEILGMSLGTLIFAVIFVVPGILLIRRSVRIRRENRAIVAPAPAPYNYAAPTAPVAPNAPTAPAQAAPAQPNNEQAPPIPPAPTV